MNIKQKIGAGLATAAMLGAVIAPATFASTTNTTISGNGNFSFNKVKVTNSNGSMTFQKNKQFVGTEVGSSSSTGGNNASGNVGGTTTVRTGPATSTVKVVVTGGANTNTAVDPCGCNTDNTTNTTISKNGNFSVNKVYVTNSSMTITGQSNSAMVMTGVDSSASTGGNNASGNVGGTTTVGTGPATSTVNVTVTGGTNTIN
ncbi:MAG: hypothetical protein ACM3IJ_05145 [Candidatus Levyibacteriota bacterium]